MGELEFYRAYDNFEVFSDKSGHHPWVRVIIYKIEIWQESMLPPRCARFFLFWSIKNGSRGRGVVYESRAHDELSLSVWILKIHQSNQKLQGKRRFLFLLTWNKFCWVGLCSTRMLTWNKFCWVGLCSTRMQLQVSFLWVFKFWKSINPIKSYECTFLKLANFWTKSTYSKLRSRGP